jgi:hypothetical protein
MSSDAVRKLYLSFYMAEAIRARENTTNPERVAALKQRIDSLYAAITGAPMGLSTLEISTPELAVPVLAAHWDSMRHAAPVDRVLAASYLHQVLLQVMDAQKTQTGDWEKPDGPAHQLWDKVVAVASQERSEQHRSGLYRKATARGETVVRVFLDEAVHLQSEIDAYIRANSREAMTEFKAAVDELGALHAAKEARDGSAYTEEETARVEELKRRVEELLVRMSHENAMTGDHSTAAAHRRMPEAMAELGRKVIDAVKSASPVSEEQAATWAKAQAFTPEFLDLMRLQGYDQAQLLADMAEFYRLAGGRIAGVIMDVSESHRANASQIHGHRSGIVRAGRPFPKRTLFHELAHHLERDPAAAQTSMGFLQERRESSRSRPLNDILGLSGSASGRYGEAEVAFVGPWFDPYVGRDYSEQAGGLDVTEVMSMGVESFSDPKLLALRMLKDPVHFKLMAGFLTAEPDQLFPVMKSAHAQRLDVERQAHLQTREELIRKKAESSARVKLAGQRSKLRPEMPTMAKASGAKAYKGQWKSERTGITYHVWKVARVMAKGSKVRPAPGYVVFVDMLSYFTIETTDEATMIVQVGYYDDRQRAA